MNSHRLLLGLGLVSVAGKVGISMGERPVHRGLTYGQQGGDVWSTVWMAVFRHTYKTAYVKQ